MATNYYADYMAKLKGEQSPASPSNSYQSYMGTLRGAQAPSLSPEVAQNAADALERAAQGRAEYLAREAERRREELERQRRQAQIDLDVNTINRIDAQLKQMRAEQGQQTFADRVGDTIGAAASGTVGNVANAVGTVADVFNGAKQPSNLYNFADIAAKDTERFTSDAKEGLGKVGQFAVDAGIAGAQLAGDIVASSIVPGSGLALMGTRAFGGAAQEARQDGATLGQQVAYGAGSAATSMLTEKLFNVAGPYAKAFGNGFFDKLVSRATKTAAGKMLLSAISEGGEEALESVVQPFLKNLTYSEGEKVNWNDVKYDALIGSLLGLVGGAGDVMTRSPNSDTQKPSGATEAVAEGTDTAAATPPQKASVGVAEASAKPINPFAEQMKPQAKPADPLAEAAVGKPMQETAVQQSEQGAVGAAEQGFESDFSRLQNQSTEFYPEGANVTDKRAVDTPVKDFEGKTISRFANNALGADAISNETAAVIEQMVADGMLSDDVLHNRDALAQAEAKINDIGIDGAMEKLRQAAARKESSPELVAMMEALLIDAEAASTRNGERAAELVMIGAELSRSAARATQLLSHLRKMSPTYQIHAIEQAVASAEEATKSGKQRKQEEVVRAEADAVRAAHEQRDSVIGTIQTMIAEYKAEYGKKAEGKGWVQTLGDELAKTTASRATDKKTRARTIYENIASDLNAFMAEHVDARKNTAPKRTAADRLADFFANRQEYSRAWNDARKQLREKYKNNPAMLDRLEDFLNAPIGFNGEGPDTTMLRAVTQAALENDLKTKDIVIRNKYDVDGLVEQVASTLIQQTNARGNDQTVIRDAVRRHLNEKALDSKSTAEKYFDADIRETLKNMGETVSAVMKTGTKNKDDMAKKIADSLVKQYGISTAGAKSAADGIVKQFNSMMEASAESYLKSRFGDNVPKEAKSFGEKLAELANAGAFTNPNYSEAATASVVGADMAKSIAGTAEWKALTDRFKSAESAEARDVIISDMQQYVADNSKKSLGERAVGWFTAMRYINMLGNLKTPGRNLIGNIANRAIYMVDNASVAVAEKLTRGKYGKTRSVFVSPELAAVGRADADKVSAKLYEGGKYAEGPMSANNFMRGVDEKRKTFGDIDLSKFGGKSYANPLEGAKTAVDWIMNNKRFGDKAFLRNGYGRFLAGYLKANNVTAAQWNDPAWQKANAKFVEKARDNSIRLAREAAFRQDNAFSEWVRKIGRRPDTPWYGRMASEGIAPFRKTPANVAVEIVEHSPIGYADALIKGLQAKSGAVDKNGEVKADATDVIESLAKATSGSALLGVGALLFAAGALSAGPGDDDEQTAFNDLVGKQDYAIQLPDGRSFTIDWLTPTATPLVAGAEIMRLMQEEGEGWDKFIDGLAAMSDIFIESSFVSGLKDTFDSVKYSDNNLAQVAMSSIIGYLTQGFTSTLGGQLERTFQPDSMMTYVDKNKKVPDFLQKAIGKTSAKLPGDYNQIPYINAWGETESEGDVMTRAINNLINPAYSSKTEMDDTEKELQRLYDAVGSQYGRVFPSRADKYIEVSKSVYDPLLGENISRSERKNLTAEEYVKYAQAKGQNSKQLVQQAISSPAYKSMKEGQKAEFIAKMYGYADYKARKTVAPQYESSMYAKYEEAERQGITPAEYYVYDTTTNDMEADKGKNGKSISGSKKEKVVEYINNSNFSRTEKDWLYLLDYSSDDEKKNQQNLRDLPWNR